MHIRTCKGRGKGCAHCKSVRTSQAGTVGLVRAHSEQGGKDGGYAKNVQHTIHTIPFFLIMDQNLQILKASTSSNNVVHTCMQ